MHTNTHLRNPHEARCSACVCHCVGLPPSLPPAVTRPAVTPPHSHCPLPRCHVLNKLCLDVAELFFPAFFNPVTRRLTEMLDHLCQGTTGQAPVLVFVFTPAAPLTHVTLTRL